MTITGKSDIGLVRKTNQDTFTFGQLGKNASYAIVCDGMGGENGGSVASEIACDAICSHIRQGYRSRMDANSIRNLLITAVHSANAAVYQKSASTPGLEGMGTTVVAAVMTGNMAYLAHVGDSRAYLHNTEETVRITTDHSIVQVLIDQGKLTEDAAKRHPQKNLITRAVGVEPAVDVDYTETELLTGDVLLLCTDGLTNMCDDLKMREILLQYPPAEACEQLIDAAKKAGGKDNITVVTACIP